MNGPPYRGAMKKFVFPRPKHPSRLVIITVVLGSIVLAGSSCSDGGQGRTSVRDDKAGEKLEMKPQRLESYTIKGMIFTYYLISSGLGREELIATAQALHRGEPKAQLILVDETAQLKDYINYAREFSRGNTDAYYPLEWAKQHVIANAQKYVSGKWMLCRGVGADEIAELR